MYMAGGLQRTDLATAEVSEIRKNSNEAGFGIIVKSGTIYLGQIHHLIKSEMLLENDCNRTVASPITPLFTRQTKRPSSVRFVS
jgi:hypothetical protein